MKYKTKYNFILSFMLVVITLTATMFFCWPKFNQVESEKAPTDVLEEVENDEVNTAGSTLKKVNFNNFKTALTYACNYMKSVTGYKSYTYGKFGLNVKNLVNIEQSIQLESEVNNKNKSSHTTLCIYGDGKIKNNSAYEFAKIGDEVSMRKSSDRVDDEFDYTDEEVKRQTLEEFKSEWSILPEEALTKFSASRVTNGIMTQSKGTYQLTFTLESGDFIRDNVIFVKRFFENSEISKQINPSFRSVGVVMTLDSYGRPKTIEYSVDFYNLSLYGVGIPLSRLTGEVSYTQRLFAYGQNITVNNLPDPPKPEE